MVDENRFLKLIEDNGGFEVTLGFRRDVDHFIGGTGNKLWYLVHKGSNEDYYLCTLNGSEKKDVHYTLKKQSLSCKPAPSGKTLDLILSEIAIGQKEIEESGRKPLNTELRGHRCSHYSFAFGERAYKIADEFGVTVEYSNLADEEAGFRLRDIRTGAEVTAPPES